MVFFWLLEWFTAEDDGGIFLSRVGEKFTGLYGVIFQKILSRVT
jgi:hypothetical protein